MFLREFVFIVLIVHAHTCDAQEVRLTGLPWVQTITITSLSPNISEDDTIAITFGMYLAAEFSPFEVDTETFHSIVMEAITTETETLEGDVLVAMTTGTDDVTGYPVVTFKLTFAILNPEIFLAISSTHNTSVFDVTINTTQVGSATPGGFTLFFNESSPDGFQSPSRETPMLSRVATTTEVEDGIIQGLFSVECPQRSAVTLASEDYEYTNRDSSVEPFCGHYSYDRRGGTTLWHLGSGPQFSSLLEEYNYVRKRYAGL